MCKVHISLALDRRLLNPQNRRYNVKVIVYFNHDGRQLRRKCNTQCYLTDEEFRKLYQNGSKSDYIVETRVKIDSYFAEIKSICDRLGSNFSFEKFDTIFKHRGLAIDRGRPSIRPKERKSLFNGQTEFTDVYTCFRDYIKELYDTKRIGTAISYKAAMSAFYKYRPDLMFSDITPAFLYGFEEKMLNQKLSVSTIGIYARSLRTIVNMAITDGLLPHERYPFGARRKRKYQIPATRNIKKALSVDDIKRIKEIELNDENLAYARDIWMFSFYCNGMNVADIFFLKYKDISRGYLRFIRRKTLNTQREQIPVEVFLTEPAMEIIARRGNHNTSPEGYVFSNIEGIYDPKRLYELKCNFTRSINYHMHKVAKQACVEHTLTTVVARHSFATVLKNLGVATEQISECLGHSDVKTTKFYLDSFSDDHKKQTAQLLTTVI